MKSPLPTPGSHQPGAHLKSALRVSAGQDSQAGVKASNDDSLGIKIPAEPLLTTKGIAIAIADGVSEAEHGKDASDICIQNFLSDYYSTPDSWSVKTSVQRVFTALNRWLYSQGNSLLTPQRGYVTTLSVIVLKSQVGYVFHVGDSRIYRYRESMLEQLTTDHVTRISADKEYLARAMGIDIRLDIDFRQIDIQVDDCIFTCTDGVYKFLSRHQIESLIGLHLHDPETCCRAVNEVAQQNGSDDNTSCQLVRVDQLAPENNQDVYLKLSELSFPPPLQPGAILDGYRIIEELHASSRSQVYRVQDEKSGGFLVMKTPSPNYQDDPAYIERFIMEEWVGSRIQSDFVVKVCPPHRTRRFLYYLVEDVDGTPLGKWMATAKRSEIVPLVGLIQQIGKGLRALHRRETLHQDLKPDNILVDRMGKPRIIDFGSCRVAGIQEIVTPLARDTVLGTFEYSAPELLCQAQASERSDLFSLAAIAYELLTGQLPYGAKYETCKTVEDFSQLVYRPAWTHNPHVPLWMDGALKKALQIDSALRYDSLSEFLFDLEHPNPDVTPSRHLPWVERNPLRFWQAISAILAVTCVYLLFVLAQQ